MKAIVDVTIGYTKVVSCECELHLDPDVINLMRVRAIADDTDTETSALSNIPAKNAVAGFIEAYSDPLAFNIGQAIEGFAERWADSIEPRIRLNALDEIQTAISIFGDYNFIVDDDEVGSFVSNLCWSLD